MFVCAFQNSLSPYHVEEKQKKEFWGVSMCVSKTSLSRWEEVKTELLRRSQNRASEKPFWSYLSRFLPLLSPLRVCYSAVCYSPLVSPICYSIWCRFMFDFSLIRLFLGFVICIWIWVNWFRVCDLLTISVWFHIDFSVMHSISHQIDQYIVFPQSLINNKLIQTLFTHFLFHTA